MLSKVMLVMKAPSYRFRPLVDADREVCHARHRFQDRGIMRRRRRVWSPAKRPMVCDQHSGDGSIIDFFKRPYYDMPGVELIVRSNFGLFHHLRDGYRAMKVIGMRST